MNFLATEGKSFRVSAAPKKACTQVHLGDVDPRRGIMEGRWGKGKCFEEERSVPSPRYCMDSGLEESQRPAPKDEKP